MMRKLSGLQTRAASRQVLWAHAAVTVLHGGVVQSDGQEASFVPSVTCCREHKLTWWPHLISHMHLLLVAREL